jgi:hypothetical protein
MQRAEDENRERSGDDNEDSDEDEGKISSKTVFN